MDRWNGQLRWIIIFAALLLCWIASLSLAYVGMSFLFQKWAPDAPRYWFVMAVGMTGSFIFFLGAYAIGHWMNPRSFPLIDEVNGAMRRIAKGDFDVNLDHIGKNEPFSELAHNFHAMAHDLKQMELLRQQFVSDVSHEIQSPLTSIGGFAKVLRTGTLDEAARDRYLTIIETESKRLSALSDNLLKLASLDSESYPLDLKPYRLDRGLRTAALALEPQWMGKGLSLRAELPEITAYADEELMQQVWVNLLTNSIKFTPSGGEIEMGAARVGEKWHIYVRDSGAGIPEEHLSRIFERFYKADRSRNREQGGSGLGLSIVKRIIERHNGLIETESTVGKGTTIRIVLPEENMMPK
ncbi:sensor histidine kinase [Paenibacillus sp. GCM10027627]|uniref:sensor histidine kinase n=1 Tax=unclassified Paenibacillus TaxID=185978 RepID=UPI00364130B2